MPGQALAQADLAPLIHSPHVKHALCNVDPEDVHLWFHWTRLLWLYEFTALAPIVAHRSRAAQGAGPFHYDPLDARVQGQGWSTRVQTPHVPKRRAICRLSRRTIFPSLIGSRALVVY